MDLLKPAEWIESVFYCYVFRNPSAPHKVLSGVNMFVCHNWFQNSKRMRFVADGAILDYQEHLTSTMLYRYYNGKYYIASNKYYTLEKYTNGFELIGAIFMPNYCLENVCWAKLESIAPGIVQNNPDLTECKIFEMKPIWFGHDPVPYIKEDADIQQAYKPIYDRARGLLISMKLQDLRGPTN